MELSERLVYAACPYECPELQVLESLSLYLNSLLCNGTQFIKCLFYKQDIPSPGSALKSMRSSTHKGNLTIPA